MRPSSVVHFQLTKKIEGNQGVSQDIITHMNWNKRCNAIKISSTKFHDILIVIKIGDTCEDISLISF